LQNKPQNYIKKMKKKENESMQLHTVKEAIDKGFELIGKYLPSTYKDLIKEKYPKVDLERLQKVRNKMLKAENNLKEFNYLVELSKAQERQLDYLEELVKL
jgi:uncharacterized protein with HEPN domain